MADNPGVVVDNQPQPPPQAQPQEGQQVLLQIPLGQVNNEQPVQFNQPLMGPLVGSLAPYDPSGRLSFAGWLQLFANFCLLNGIPEEPQDANGQFFPIQNLRRMIFIQFIGERAYEEIRRACLPLQPHQRSIRFMCSVVRAAFEPEGLVEANRLRFSNLVQRDNQSAQSFINSLQLAAENCNFGAAYNLCMKSRLLAGIRCDRTREALLAQSARLDYSGTKALFLQLDAARMQSQELARAANVYNVDRAAQSTSRRPASDSRSENQKVGQRHEVRQQKDAKNTAKRSPVPSASSSECTRCGGDHPPSSCWAKNQRCYQCNRFGHTARKCNNPRKIHHTNDQTEEPEVFEDADDRLIQTVYEAAFGKKPSARSDLNLDCVDTPFCDDIQIGHVELKNGAETMNHSITLVKVVAPMLTLLCAFTVLGGLRFSWPQFSFARWCCVFLSFALFVFCLGADAERFTFPGFRRGKNITSKVNQSPSLVMPIRINKTVCQMELDTGAGVTLFPLDSFRDKFGSVPLNASNLVLTGVSGPIKIFGEAIVKVSCPESNVQFSLPIVVCYSSHLKLPLIGRNWLDILFPTWRNQWKDSI